MKLYMQNDRLFEIVVAIHALDKTKDAWMMIEDQNIEHRTLPLRAHIKPCTAFSYNGRQRTIVSDRVDEMAFRIQNKDDEQQIIGSVIQVGTSDWTWFGKIGYYYLAPEDQNHKTHLVFRILPIHQSTVTTKDRMYCCVGESNPKSTLLVIWDTVVWYWSLFRLKLRLSRGKIQFSAPSKQIIRR